MYFVITQSNVVGGQEGALDNVRLNVSGEQGHLLKQVLSSFAVTRNALCSLTSSSRSHIIVSHDKGKVYYSASVNSDSRVFFLAIYFAAGSTIEAS